MKNITVSAPGKLMLFGEHAVVFGYPCIVTAVDQRLSCSILTNTTDFLEINSPDVELNNYRKKISTLGIGVVPKSAKFIEYSIKNFFDKYHINTGVNISTKSEFKSTFGFGSSSAVTVCVIKGLSDLFNINLTKKEIFSLSYKTVLDVQGKGSGFDIAAAIYGGTVYFENKGETIDSIATDFDLVVGYSGVKADTVEMINIVEDLKSRDPELIKKIFRDITINTNEARNLFTISDLKRLGELMNASQKLLIDLEVSTDKLNKMCEAAISSGAFGAKLSGAGGGDCMIALVDKNNKEKIKKAIESADVEVIDVSVNAEGVKIV